MKFTLQFLESIEIILKFVITVLCAGLLAFDRRSPARKDFTRILIITAFATCFMVLLWQQLGLWQPGLPSVIFFASQIIALGIVTATFIVLHRADEEGLQLSIMIWIAGGIGMAIGFALYFTAIIATLLSYLLLMIINRLDLKK